MINTLCNTITMFIPKDREIVLELPASQNSPQIQCISANRERRFIAVATSEAIFIWLSNPQLLLCSISIDNETWKGERGELRQIYWRPDSQAIAVTTNRNQLFIYAIEVQPDESCYNFVDSEDPYFQRNSHELFIKSFRPVVNIKPVYNISLADIATRCVAFRDELLVCVQNGFTHHVTWNGDIIRQLSFRLTSIPFSPDQMQSKAEYITSTSTHIVDTVYAPLNGGYIAVLSDGRAALLTSNDPNFAPNTILGVWASNLKDAVCCDMNHKFLLMLFGCKNGDVCAYNIEEQSGSLMQSFRVSPRVTNGPDFTNRLGPVHSIRAIPSGFGFAAVWSPIAQVKNAEREIHPLSRLYAVFTPCGAQSFCNLENVVEESTNDNETREEFTAMEWGPEGYQLWLGTTSHLQMQPFIRSASCSSPVMEHSDRVVMSSDSQVLISATREREADACAPHSVWDHITVTHEYLSANWPIRYASIDRNYNHLVVAGERGFAYCSMGTRRWKIFGNESQEKNLVVTGGVFIWNDTIGVVGAYMDSDKSVLSFYPISQKLDDRYASVIDLDNRSTMVALRDDVCAIFDISAQITLFKLSFHGNGGRDSYSQVSAEIVSVIRINELILHPACVVSLQMTKLNNDVKGVKPTPVFHSTIDTVLINISGRLITLSINDDGKLHQPTLIASYVEKMWHDRCVVSPPRSNLNISFNPALSDKITDGWKSHTRSSSNLSTPSTSTLSDPPSPFSESSSSHLNNALWIACGAKGIKVWMPLIPGRRSTSTQEMTFIAKRIMLPFELDIYPVVICASDCLAMGVESQLHQVAKTSKKEGKSESIATYGLHRNSEVFVHHLLRQLLKRNLGVFALELAAACRSLPHFSHSLELLLHGVLEEEATSSEPIPDPLLPRCVAFIHEFPEFLKTVAHCARKTELALWPTLFDVTGSPNALFEECLRQGQLENAASFVIVLQSLESTETSMEQAARLVNDALKAKKWTIAREMIRFARSIGAEDIDLVTPPQSAKTSISRRPTVSTPTGINEQSNEFVINRFQAGGPARLSKVRLSQTNDSKDSTSSQRKDSTGSTTKEKMNLARGFSGDLSPPLSKSNRLALRMMSILEEHCWHLINNYWILDFGYFWAELQFDVVGLLETRRKQLLLSPKTTNENCYLIEDFALALTRLHAQFCWPYPITGTQFVHQIEKKLGTLKNSQSTASFNGFVGETESSNNLEKEKEKTKVKKLERTIVKIENTRKLSSDGEDEVEIREAVLERVVGNKEDADIVNSSQNSSSPNGQSGLSAATPSSSDSRSLAGDWQSADFLVGERSRGNSEKSRQMEYMLNLFVQAAAVDWIFLMCLISRDERRLRQEINLAIIKRVGEKSFARVRLACSELARWAVEKCCGYVTLLQAFDAHLTMVAEQAGIVDLKYNGTINKNRNSSTDSKTDDRNSRIAVTNKNSKLDSTFSGGTPIGNRRERSRSADRAHRSVRRYDDVVCAEDALEKADEDGCSIM